MQEKKLLKYILPSMIASLFLGVYVLVDGAFIGSKMGDIGLTAINLAWPITAFIQSVGLAIGISGGIRLSIAEGKNDEEQYNRIFNSTMILLLIISVLFTILFIIIGGPLLKLSGASGNLYDLGMRYLMIMIYGSVFQVFSGGLLPLLKNVGKAKRAMFISISGTLVNCLLDYLLIFVFEYDLLGAALASICCQGVIATLSFISLKPKFRFKNIEVTKILIGAIAPFILNYSYAIITILNNTFCLKFGGESAVACYTIFSYLLYIVQASASGSGDGVQPLISYYYGKSDFKNMYKTYFKSLILGLSFSSILIFTFLILKRQIPVFYNLSDVALEYYNDGFYYYFIAFFLLVITRINGCFLYSSNNIKESNLLTLLEPVVITPLSLIPLAYVSGVKGIFGSFLLIQAILLIISIILAYVKRKHSYANCQISS